MWAEFQDFVRQMPWFDRLGFFGAASVFPLGLLPWRETAADGELIGFFTAGIFVVLAAGGALFALVQRSRAESSARRSDGASLALKLQTGAALFVLVFPFLFIPAVSDGTRMRALDGDLIVAASQPGIGASLVIGSGLLLMVGTVFAWVHRSGAHGSSRPGSRRRRS